MQLQLYEHRQAELAAKIAALRGAAAASNSNNGSGSGSGAGGDGSGPGEGEGQGDEEEKEAESSRPNIIGNAEEMGGSGPNVASPFIRMQSQ